MRDRFKAGDIIQCEGSRRKIVDVRSSGYGWCYPEWPAHSLTPGGDENYWWSENSSDPMFVFWQLDAEGKSPQ